MSAISPRGTEDKTLTHVKISQAITRLLAQQPCNNTVNMIEQDW